MSISFSQVPINWAAPGVFAEIDNSQAYRGLVRFKDKILVLGNRRSTGSVAALTLKLVNSADEAATYFGAGSQLHNIFQVLKANNRYTETWAIALDDVLAGVAAVGSIAVAASSAAAGTINLYIAGRRIPVGVAANDTANTIAAAINTAIAAVPDLPVTSSVSTNTVTLTARHKGAFTNGIDVRVNHYGELGGEVTPSGVTLTITQPTGGTTNPDIATAFAALDDEIYNYILCPYDDTANLNALHTELLDRWDAMRQLEGHGFVAKKDTHANLVTFGTGRNSQFTSVLGFYNSPSPAYEWAAAFCGQVAFAATNDPARPFQTLPLKGVLAPPRSDRWTQEEANILLGYGVSPYETNSAGEVSLSRVVTSYLKNTSNVPDPSYRDANTMFTLSYLRQSFRAFIVPKSIGARQKLANDTQRSVAGANVITPKIMRNLAIAWYSLICDAFLGENMEDFKNELVVERDPSDPNRLNLLLPPDLVNQLLVIGAKIQYRLN